MIIFIYGLDSYRRRQKLKEIADKYAESHLNGRFDFSENKEEELLQFKEFVSGGSLFKGVKFAVLEGVFGGFKDCELEIADILKRNVENKDVVLAVYEEKSPPKKFGFLLEKPVLSQEFEILEGGRAEFFIKKEADKRGLKINKSAVVFLAEIFKGDGWGLINEFDKISALGRKNLDAAFLKNFVDYPRPLESREFFWQIGGLASQSIGRTLAGLEILFSRGEEPAKIFNILAASKRNNPQVVKKFADCDAAIKSGKNDYEEALLDMAL